jgi:hypothetical protein
LFAAPLLRQDEKKSADWADNLPCALQLVSFFDTINAALLHSGFVGPLSQRVDAFSLPSDQMEGGGIVVSYQELFLLIDMIVNVITLVILLIDRKK